MLKEEQKKQIDEWTEDQDIDVTELYSYQYDKDPYGVGPELRGWSGCYVWDEDEEYTAKIEQAIDNLTADGWDGYFDCDEGQDPDELTKEAIEYLRAK